MKLKMTKVFLGRKSLMQLQGGRRGGSDEQWCVFFFKEKKRKKVAAAGREGGWLRWAMVCPTDSRRQLALAHQIVRLKTNIWKYLKTKWKNGRRRKHYINNDWQWEGTGTNYPQNKRKQTNTHRKKVRLIHSQNIKAHKSNKSKRKALTAEHKIGTRQYKHVLECCILVCVLLLLQNRRKHTKNTNG